MTESTSKKDERSDLLETLGAHRKFLLQTVGGITEEQAAMRTTVSQLCLGGLIKHVSQVEKGWTDFIVEGPSAIGDASEAAMKRHSEGFQVLHGETLAGILEHYEEVSKRTDDLVRSLPDLDAAQPLPEAPWFEPGGRWTARRVLLHIIAETSQHAGHADIIREALDGAKTMG